MAISTGGGRKVLPAAPLPPRPAFRRQFVDFERGIRMGGLEPHERITQIVKYALRERHGQDFIVQKWGRGRFWQWICWLVRANRQAKPLSAWCNFSCAKFYVSLDCDGRTLDAGMQVERALLRRGPGQADELCARPDWDFWRLVRGLRRGSALEKELARLVAVEGFTAHVGGAASGRRTFRGRRWGGAAAVRRALRGIPEDAWGWFQVYYSIGQQELMEMDGPEIIAAVLAIFDEVAPAMNLVMTEPFLRVGRRGAARANI